MPVTRSSASRISFRFAAGAACAVGALGLLLALLAGCNRSDTVKPGDGDAPAVSGVGDTITVPYAVDITGVNELTAASATLNNGILQFGLFMTLADEQADYQQGPPSIAPRIATSWEFSDDRKKLTFHLRDDLVWSDGEPITAEDVRFTWQAQVDPDIAWNWVDYKRKIDDVEVVDSQTVVFHFSEVYANQLMDAIQGVILPKHAWGELPFADWPNQSQWFVDHLVVSGPYDLESWEPGQRIVLKQNDRYFEAPEIPKTDRIIFEIIPDLENQLSMLRSGAADFVELIPPADADKVQADPETYLITYMPRFFAFIVWNTQNPLFADAGVRRALTQGIDRQAIIDSLYYGFGRVANTAITPDVWAHNGDLDPMPYDPDASRAGLAAAGWADSDGDGILDKDGTPFRFELLTNSESPVRKDIIVIVQEQLKRVGIDARPRTMEFNAMLAPLSKQEFDAALSVLALSTDLDLSYNYHTRGIATGYNWGGFSDPEVDALLDEIATELNPFDNLERLRRVQELVQEKQPVTFLYHALRLSAARTSLRDVNPNTLNPFANLARWRRVDPAVEPLPEQPDPRAGLH